MLVPFVYAAFETDSVGRRLVYAWIFGIIGFRRVTIQARNGKDVEANGANRSSSLP